MSDTLECEYCNGTGYYGDNGPGITGNTEFMECDYCHPSQPKKLPYTARRLEASHARLVKALEWTLSPRVWWNEQCKLDLKNAQEALAEAKALTGEAG